MALYVFIFYGILLATVGVIIINTNTSSKALAYLMLIFLLPGFGLLVYFLIGRNYRVHKMYTKKLQIDRDAFPKLEEDLRAYSDKTLAASNASLEHYINLARFSHLEHLLTADNKTELLLNGEVKFPEVLRALDAAKHHIHIEYYIFEDDEIGQQVADVLIKKSRAGIEVRLIYDDYGSKSIRRSFVKRLRDNGIEAFPFYEIQLLLFANRVNYRNHRKIIVVDGQVGFVGGINISEKYVNPNNHELYWRDTHLKLTGSSVLSLQRIFIADWNFCAKQGLGVMKCYFPITEIPTQENGQLVQIIHSGPDSDHPSILYGMIQAIILSKKEVLITTPYFVPDLSFLNAIKIARLSQVRVKLLVPGISDSIIVNATSNSYYQELLEIGVEIYRYQKGFVHAKTMVCDHLLSVIGTTNLDERSFDLNFEVNAFVYDKTLADQLRKSFNDDISDSQKLSLQEWRTRPILERFGERVCRLLSPLM